MARTRDPIRNFAYVVIIDGFSAELGFKSVSGLNRELEEISYREGGDNYTPRKMPGQATFSNVVLERGKYFGEGGEDVMDWMHQVYDHLRGTIQENDGFRRDVTVQVRDRAGTPVKEYILVDAWPCKLEHDDLVGDGTDVWIERVELCHEGLIEVSLA